MENKNNGLFQDFVLEFEAKDKLFKEYSSQFRARLITIAKYFFKYPLNILKAINIFVLHFDD
jgi:hypothetical protein